MGRVSPARFHGAELEAYKAGQIDQRLDNFDEHFKVVNGSIGDSATAIKELVSVVAGMQMQLKIGAYVAGVFLTAWVSAMAYLLLHIGK